MSPAERRAELGRDWIPFWLAAKEEGGRDDQSALRQLAAEVVGMMDKLREEAANVRV